MYLNFTIVLDTLWGDGSHPLVSPLFPLCRSLFQCVANPPSEMIGQSLNGPPATDDTCVIVTPQLARTWGLP
ncbi:hypothetical protein CEXT_453031 [Caerostris extrusa]|uniref:Uncharacterized protein n=1 Tax=Caerostris extrusa TaxID=172846 RepID=A0AAV4PJI5_CAEEX|nr:hypothetical protein CEXT_453031 [Caerostris extrusa]